MHWREHTNSPLLGAYSCWSDTADDFTEINAIITHAAVGEFVLGASGKTKCLVCFTDLGKPVKVNVTIANAIQNIVGTANTSKWVNIPVTFYVDKNVKSKDGIVPAIRVKPQINAPKNDWKEQIEHLKTLKTVQELQDAYFALPELAKPELSAFIQTLVDAINTKKL